MVKCGNIDCHIYLRRPRSGEQVEYGLRVVVVSVHGGAGRRALALRPNPRRRAPATAPAAAAPASTIHVLTR